MRLIDADALKQFEITMPRGDGYSDFVFAGHIHKAPTIYAVPVVRCKDCKHRYKDGINVVFNRCELNHNKVQSDDWYCADGEREDDV